MRLASTGLNTHGDSAEESTDAPRCQKCLDTGVYTKDGMTFICSCQKAERANNRRKYSGLPPFETHDMLPTTRDYIARYSILRNSATNWLAYMGRTGCGKSTQAFMVVDALLKRRVPVYAKVYYYPELVRDLSALRFDYARYEERLETILEPELVVFDDFLDVIPKQESFEETVALMLIKRRYQDRKPLIITTEITPNMFKQQMPRHCEAILGRIVEMTDGRISIADNNAPNYRLEKGI